MSVPIVIGGGLAGLASALALAPHPVTVLAAAPLGQGAASAWAQGGLAAAIGADDTPDLHHADTLAAGDGLCDPTIVRAIVEAGPDTVASLARLGVRFDRAVGGDFRLGLEAGHARRRIVHAGDATGAEILGAVIAAVRATPSITVHEGVIATRLVRRNDGIAGVLVRRWNDGATVLLPASQVVIATGGAGALWRHTTNPLGAIGSGLLLAARAGAVLANLEFLQFHPTALDVGLDPMPLVSEALRGEGATLIDEAGDRFMAGHGRAELEPRDVVSRAVWAHAGAGHRVFLDARHVPDVARRFPGIAARCAEAGLDLARQPIPVRPAAHYHMGGIAVDADGRSTVPGLYAAGEAACTGLHGANRLASNSLLEAAVSGTRVARAIAATPRTAPAPLIAIDPPRPAALDTVRTTLDSQAGVLRDAAGLRTALATLEPLAEAGDDPATLARLMVLAMLAREESRGGHWRTDRLSQFTPPRPSRLRLIDGEPVIDQPGTPTVEEIWAAGTRP